MRLHAFLTLAALMAAIPVRVACGAEGDDEFGAEYNIEWSVEAASHGDGIGSRSIQGRYFLEPVDDYAGGPYRLQPFLQQASYAGGFLSGIDVNEFSGGVAGRYMFDLPDASVDVGVTARLGFGSTADGSLFLVSAGADLYLAEDSDFALETTLAYAAADEAAGRVEGVTFELGARYFVPDDISGGGIEAFAGFSATSGDRTSNGVILEGRYYFDEVVFAGLRLDWDTLTASAFGGFWSGDGFQAEVEGGGGGARGGFVRVSAGMRF